MFTPEPNRIDPQMPVSAYKTYQILQPRATHFLPASCEKVQCQPYLHGWRTTVDEGSTLGQQQAAYIRSSSGRRFEETRLAAGLTEFVFEAGQRCFAADQHIAPVGRPEVYVVRDGDWRGNPTGQSRRHVRPADWVEDFADHQDRLATRAAQG